MWASGEELRSAARREAEDRRQGVTRTINWKALKRIKAQQRKAKK